MTGFARRPLACFVCCLFGLPPAFAADEAVPSAGPSTVEPLTVSPADRTMGLHVERKFNVLGKKPAAGPYSLGIDYPAQPVPGDVYPLFIRADRMGGRVGDANEAFGNVELRRLGARLYADRVSYRAAEDEVDAFGHVRLLQEGAEVNSPHLRIKLADQVGFAESADFRFAQKVHSKLYVPQQTVVSVTSNSSGLSGAPMMLNVPNSYGLPTTVTEKRLMEGNGQAERIEFEGENQVRMTAATFSTCKPDDMDWYLKSREMFLDYDRNEGDARDASIWFKGVPILYSPVVLFPLGSERRSGFLHPHFAASTKNGLDFTLPYYWNLAPNYDLMLSPRYMSKRGNQLGAEARYLGFNYEGFSRVEYLPNDEIRGRSRYGYQIDHRQNLGRGFSGVINWNGVSDDNYWQDLSSRLLQTSQTQLPRQAMLAYSPAPWLRSSLQVLRYQTLQPDPTTTIAKPYFLEPQLNVIGYKPDLLATDLTVIGQFSRFTHQDPAKVKGDRVVFYPQLSLPIITPGFQITPKVGVHLTSYALDNPGTGQPDSLNRSLPTFSLDSTVSLEREGDWFGSSYVQTLEPRLYYVRIPYKDQSYFPVFDSGLADFNFAQIFSENRYTGFDRINDANQLTAALTSRLLDGTTGVERFKAMVGQRYYFSPQRVTITGETTRQADFSNLVAAANGLVAAKTYADIAWEYNYRDERTERFAIGGRFQPDYGKVVSASYRYTRDPLSALAAIDQIDLAGQWPLSGKYYAVGRYNYSLRDSKVLESIGGLEYNAGCWALRVVAQRLAAISGSPNTTLFVQLELNDFGSIGSSPLGLLRRSIPGYGKVNELPDSGSLLTSQ